MKKILCGIIAVMLLFVTNYVYAANATINLTPNVTTAKPGDTVNVTISVSNINVTGTDDPTVGGINAIIGILEYDTAIFETPTKSNVTAKEDWVVQDITNGKIQLTRVMGVSKTSDIVTIPFKNSEFSRYAYEHRSVVHDALWQLLRGQNR